MMARYNTHTGEHLPPEHHRVPRGTIRMQKSSDVDDEMIEVQDDAIITPRKLSRHSQEEIVEGDQSDALFFIRSVLGVAIGQGVSDVHFEPRRNTYQIRFRIDGVLRRHAEQTIDEYKQIVNAVKVLSDMDIAERAIPQDGHIELVQEGTAINPTTGVEEVVGHYYDIRVSVFPSVNGEVMVMRILNRENALLTTQQLGMDKASLDKLHEVLLTSYGMILITGPTGSGKTTTLYSILGELKDDEKNIITLEDPIEFHLEWLRQCEIRERRGFTFERAMESVLRQDPDVLMVGEIRDPQTAEHAVRSALVGRIVGSTIHANTTIGTIARLVELGISRNIIGHTINVIIAQRLVRRICDSCKTVYTPDERLLAHFGMRKAMGPFFKGKGCDKCEHSGYKGRTGIFSLMVFDDAVRNLLFDHRPLAEVQDYAIKHGMKTLKVDAAEKILAGVTTVEEASRVI